ncbi:hypothetical protein HKX48_008262, partial [Thoreauomyces humboldtii]
ENTNVTESFHTLVRECRRYFPAGESPSTHGGGSAGGGSGGRGGRGAKKSGFKCAIL